MAKMGRPPNPALAHLTKKQRIRRSSLMQRYGIDLDDFDRILASQGGRCGICGEVTERWHVDHDHVTGHVRGVLCRQCNTALGAFGDNVEGLQRAIAYLRRHKEQ